MTEQPEQTEGRPLPPEVHDAIRVLREVQQSIDGYVVARTARELYAIAALLEQTARRAQEAEAPRCKLCDQPILDEPVCGDRLQDERSRTEARLAAVAQVRDAMNADVADGLEHEDDSLDIVIVAVWRDALTAALTTEPTP